MLDFYLNYGLNKKEFSRAIIITGISNVILSFVLVYFYRDIGASLSFVFSECILLYFFIKYILKVRNENCI